MMITYPRLVEEAMCYTFSTLNERQRRLFAATEALKLGYGASLTSLNSSAVIGGPSSAASRN